MWTPRRVLLLIASLIVFWLGYEVYAFFLETIDGLQPLPKEYSPPDSTTPTVFLDQLSLKDKMLTQAFGEDCEELHRSIRLVLRDKGIVLATDQFEIDKIDGHIVKLSPFSAAMFPKNKDAGPNDINGAKVFDMPEINTVKCDFAYLILDEPVTMASELASRKVKKVDLRGGFKNAGVTLTNNRRTKKKSDDVEVFVTMSPLYYEEERNLIWTDGLVILHDFQSQPKPTEVTANGMDLYLAPDAHVDKAKAAQTPQRPKSEKATNVDKLVLRANVKMHLYVDDNDGFLASEDKGDAKPLVPAETLPKAPPEKSHVFIQTPGPFTYDPNKEQARFDCGPIPIGGLPAGAQQQQVLVSRKHREEKFDQLICDRLDLQFRKKATAPQQQTVTADPAGGNKEIETAIATVRPGGEVLLTSDTQNIEAWGDEMRYHCAAPGRGPKTELFGSINRPMRAIKDGHKIKASDLQLTGKDPFGNGQATYSKGPGRIDLTDRDKANPKGTFPVHILWKDTLVSTQERDGDKVFELWTITEDAHYIDEDQKQELHGDKIQLWLEPNDPAHGGPKASGGPKQRLHKVEAFGHVRAAAQETIVKHADHLLMVFRPEVAPGAELPMLPEPPVNVAVLGPRDRRLHLDRGLDPEQLVKAAVESSGPPAQAAGGAAPSPRPPEGPAPVAAGSPPPAKAEARKPIVLDAEDVAIYIATLGGKKQLDKLDASGRVHVVQEPEKAGEKGLDIKGDLLNVVHDAPTDLNVLTVYGDTKKLGRFNDLARLEMNDSILFGPKVTIDQIKNRADVDGLGAMSMPSKTSLDGDRPARPGARLNIHWNKNMTFDGKVAYFYGGVQGDQDDSSILCETMQAVMDRMVVFKEGHKDGEGAKVERLLCNTKVYVKDEQFAADGKREKASILEARELDVDNLYGPTLAIGPGRFFHLAPGDDDDGGGQPGAATKGPTPKKEKDKEMQLTRINFRGRMFSNTKAGYKNAIFRDSVEVYHVPSEIFEVQLDPDKLPKGGFYIKCETLELLSKQVNNKTVQAMVAKQQVYFRNPEAFGFADVMRFDEASDIIIFEAAPGNIVKLYQRTAKENRDITGRKVLYHRKAGTFTVEDAGVIKSSRLESPPASGQTRENATLGISRKGAKAQSEIILCAFAPLREIL